MPARHGRDALRACGWRGNLDRPCRIYAPVGTHETLLAYLVRRLLGERRQQLLRASACRRENAHRRPHRRSRRGGGQIMAARRIQPSCRREICSARSERIRGASIFRTHGRAKRWNAPSMKARRRSWMRRRLSPPPLLPAAAQRQIVNPAEPRRHRGLRRRTPARPCIADAMAAAVAPAPDMGAGPRLRSAPQSWSGPRICWSNPWSGYAS